MARRLTAVQQLARVLLCRLPYRMPFSRTVPDCLRAVAAFQESYYAFLVGFPSGYAEFDDLVRQVRPLPPRSVRAWSRALTRLVRTMQFYAARQSVDLMLTGKLNRLLLDAIEESHRLHLSQAVQILINALYLEDSVGLLEKRLSEMRCDTAKAPAPVPADRIGC